MVTSRTLHSAFCGSFDTLVFVAMTEREPLSVAEADRCPRHTQWPQCPRCGYDQRGVVSTWKETCPLDGVCAECGLTFGWDEILRPDRALPRWCVEFAPRRRDVPLASIKTAMRSLWPWRFWKRLRLAYSVHWGRLAAYALLLSLTTITPLYLCVQATIAIMILKQHRVDTISYSASLGRRATVAPVRYAVPFLMAPVPSIRLTVIQEWQDMDRGWQLVATARNANPPTVNMTGSRAVVEAVFTPWSATSAGTTTRLYPAPDNKSVVVTTDPYFAPNRLHSLMRDRFVNSASQGAYEEATATGAFVAASMLILLLMPFSFLMLPATLRRAKVRFPHLLRVAAYSMFVPCALLLFAGILFMISITDAPIISAMARLAAILWTIFLIPILVIGWWHAAIKHYLRMPHALATAILMGVMCSLAVGAVMYYSLVH